MKIKFYLKDIETMFLFYLYLMLVQSKLKVY